MLIRGIEAVLAAHPSLAEYDDRIYLLSHILPHLHGKVVSVGCEIYNSEDHLCLGDEVEYITVDSNPSNARFGSPHGHVTDELLNYLEKLEPNSLDAVILFGVLGLQPDDFYTLDDHLNRMSHLLSTVVRSGGKIIIAPDRHGGSFGRLLALVKFLRWRLVIRQLAAGPLGCDLVAVRRFRLNPIFELLRVAD